MSLIKVITLHGLQAIEFQDKIYVDSDEVFKKIKELDDNNKYLQALLEDLTAEHSDLKEATRSLYDEAKKMEATLENHHKIASDVLAKYGE